MSVTKKEEIRSHTTTSSISTEKNSYAAYGSRSGSVNEQKSMFDGQISTEPRRDSINSSGFIPVSTVGPVKERIDSQITFQVDTLQKNGSSPKPSCRAFIHHLGYESSISDHNGGARKHFHLVP
jgi:hypothetical protein